MRLKYLNEFVGKIKIKKVVAGNNYQKREKYKVNKTN